MSKQRDPHVSCDRIRSNLDAYLDGEIADERTAREIALHLQDCAACREELEVLSALDARLQALVPAEAPRTLTELVDREVRDAPGRPAYRRAAVAAVASGIVLAAALAIARWGLPMPAPWLESQSAHGDDFVEFVNDHVSYVQSEHTAFIETSDTDEMRRWFRERLNFSPEIPRLANAELISGRLCFIQGRRVARVRYLGSDAEFTLFIQDMEVGAATAGAESHEGGALMTATVRGYSVACWKHHGLDYILVASGQSREVFDQLRNDAGNV